MIKLFLVRVTALIKVYLETQTIVQNYEAKILKQLGKNVEKYSKSVFLNLSPIEMLDFVILCWGKGPGLCIVEC